MRASLPPYHARSRALFFYLSVQVPAKYPYRAFSKPAVGAELSLQKRSRNMTLEDVIDAVSMADRKPPRRSTQREMQDCWAKAGPVVVRRQSDSRVSERGERSVQGARGALTGAVRLRCMRQPGHALTHDRSATLWARIGLDVHGIERATAKSI